MNALYSPSTEYQTASGGSGWVAESKTLAVKVDGTELRSLELDGPHSCSTLKAKSRDPWSKLDSKTRQVSSRFN